MESKRSKEERINGTMEDKKEVASAIVGADESWLTELSKEETITKLKINSKTWESGLLL